MPPSRSIETFLPVTLFPMSFQVETKTRLLLGRCRGPTNATAPTFPRFSAFKVSTRLTLHPLYSSHFPRQPELPVLLLLILLFNIPVLFGSCFRSLIFEPAAVARGQWWRLLTHPFIHVSWYHLLLDGTAFLSLYASLAERRMFRRIVYVVAAAAGSLLLSCAASARGSAQSLCGLSGIAHGLMAISALEMVTSHPPNSMERRVGWLIFAIVLAKAASEALSGRMCFAFLDFGLLGVPIAVSHAGGIVGSLFARLWISNSPQDCGTSAQVADFDKAGMLAPCLRIWAESRRESESKTGWMRNCLRSAHGRKNRGSWRRML